MLFDLHIDDIRSLGQRDDLTGEVGVVPLEPLDYGEILDLFGCLPDGQILLVLLDGDDIARFDEVGGDVHSLAVDGDVTVVDELTSHGPGLAEAETVDDIVEPALEQDEHILTRDAAHPGRLLVIASELLFKHAVDELDFLFLFELQGVVALLLPAELDLLAGFPGNAEVGGVDAECSALLHDGTCIFSH